ncbi:MAG: nuclear transport factor 2 family protein [Methanomicrobium sp.]|nr:nuclear transport factor 2 family protein [Methanomicrobium sp.]
MKLNEAQKAEVKETMRNYGNAYKNKDLKALLEIFSPDISGFGSGPDEIINGIEGFTRQIKRDMNQATIISVEFTDTKIFGEGNIAWATSGSTLVFTTDGKTNQTINGRSTMVLRNSKGSWRIEQLHFSLPYSEQSLGQSFPGA